MILNNPLAIILVLLIVGISVAVTIFSRRFTRTTADFYVAGRGISAVQNAMALSGDYMSAATFLGIAGLVWLYGYDGIWYSVGFFGGWILLLLFLASPIRRFGAYTIADFVSGRFHSQKLRLVVMLGTILISVLYIIPQLVGVGDILGVLLGWNYMTGVVVAGILMTIYVVVGGMKATTYNQIIQCVILWTAMFVTVALALQQFGFSYDNLLTQVSGYTQPGNWLDFQNSFSLILGLVLGTAGLPHVLIRYYTNPSGKSARWTTVGTLFIIGTFYMMAPIAGFGARALLGDDGGLNTALPLLAQYLGGEAFLGVVVAAAFAAVLSTVAGLMLATTGAIAHDLYTNIINPKASEEKQLKVAKLSTLGVGILAIIVGILAQGYNVAFLVGLAFAIAASSFFPVLLMGTWWRGTTEKGALAGLVVGIISSTTIIITNIIGLHNLSNPAIITVPATFIIIYVVSRLDGQIPYDTDEFMLKVHMPGDENLEKLD
ncbi:MAG: cation acetate symporter [Euryarchaeota archaeon]|nr:cation acetate symporter [Euryarchaeota archaeon]MBV1754169.1 cation acetate symporter [Methanobacterium sp.]